MFEVLVDIPLGVFPMDYIPYNRVMCFQTSYPNKNDLELNFRWNYFVYLIVKKQDKQTEYNTYNNEYGGGQPLSFKRNA